MTITAGYVPGRTYMNFRVYLPNQRFIRSYVSRQHFRLKEKEEGFPKGGTWVHLFGSVP